MLRLSNLRTDVQRANTSLVAPMQVHVEQLTHDLIRRASEFATHAKRQRVQLNDVVQAASAICLTCAKYDNKTQTCTVYNGAGGKRRGGAKVAHYDDFCGGKSTQSQCGSSRTLTCVSGGGKRRTSRRRTSRRRGGIYKGYCGGTGNLSQCMFDHQIEEEGNSPVCYGSGARRRRRSRRRTRGGRVLRNENKTYITKTAVYEYAKKRYNVQWTPDALSFLNTALQYHVTNVLRETQADSYYTTSANGALARVLRTYNQDA